MEATSTQALAAKVSAITIGQQAIIDAYMCLAHLTAGAFARCDCSMPEAWQSAAVILCHDRLDKHLHCPRLLLSAATHMLHYHAVVSAWPPSYGSWSASVAQA